MNLETELQSKRLPSLCRLPATPLPPDTRPCGRSLAAPQARKASQSRRRHNRQILRRLLYRLMMMICLSEEAETHKAVGPR